MIKLSIVIPAYNVEKYIERCLLSVSRQDVPKDSYEVIVVVDGSKDQTLSISQSIAAKTDNIVVHYQDNEGLSGARNNGLNFAKGEYVWFVDSDDWIENNCLNGIYMALESQVDILQLQRRLAYDDISQNHDLDFISIPKMPGKKALCQFRIPAPAQFCIYRRKFLLEKGLRFWKGIIHEDSEFKPRALYLAESISSYDKIVYNYYQRSEGNIMSSFKMKNVLDLIVVNNSLISFSENIERDAFGTFNSLLGLNTNTIVLGYNKLSISDKQETLKLLKQHKIYFRRMLQASTWKYRIEGYIFLCNIRLGLFMYNLKSKIK